MTIPQKLPVPNHQLSPDDYGVDFMNTLNAVFADYKTAIQAFNAQIDAAVTAQQFKSDVQQIKTETQQIYDNAAPAINTARDNAIATFNTAANDSKNAALLEIDNGKNAALAAVTQIKTDTQAIHDAVTVLRNETQALRDQAAQIVSGDAFTTLEQKVADIESGATAVGNAQKLAFYLPSHYADPNSVAVRTGAGDIFARIFRSQFSNQSSISGALAFRVNNEADNSIRFCSDIAAIRYWLDVFSKGEATQNFLAKAGKAADSYLLEGKRIDQVADYAFNLYIKHHEGPNGGTLNLPIAKFNYVSVWDNRGVIVLPNARAGDRVIVTIYNNGAGVVFNSGSYIQYFNSVDRGYSNNCSKKAKLTFECISGNHWRISVSKIK